MKKRKKLWWLLILVAATVSMNGCNEDTASSIDALLNEPTGSSTEIATTTTDLPTDYDGTNQEIVLNENVSTFTETDLDLSNGAWQTFSDLDSLNRVGVADAIIGKESFPTEQRDPKLYTIPTGWHQKRTGTGPNDWFYNRSHLIGHQLTGENDNPKNLMTGTRQFNTPHMENYENQVKDYIKLTGNHVRYRVTPHFLNDELVARGVQMEAQSVEDNNFSFNVYIFNIQDGYTIDYSTGRATKN